MVKTLSRFTAGLAGFLVLALGTVTDASAVTRVMPNRVALQGVNVVLWGNTTLANGTAFTLDCGNGQVTNGNVTDRTYIFRTCTYASVNTFAASLTVGGETATTQISVLNPAAGSFDHRAARINMAIEDGLRYLYFSQVDRVGRYDTNKTSWSANAIDNFTNAYTALALLAIQNHGHSITGNPNVDIFQSVVERGLNFIFDNLVQRDLTPCSEPGGNPCVNVPAPVNIGLQARTGEFHDGYSTPILTGAIAAAAGSAPGKVIPAGIGAQNANFVAGKTYSEVLQRVTNAVVWGQSDSGNGQGGWYYILEAGSSSDGSTIGWGLLGLIDAAAGGATVPNFAKTEFAKVLAQQLNSDGTFDYQVAAGDNPGNGNMAKVGIGLQGLAFTGVPEADGRVAASLDYLTDNWNVQVDGYDGFACFTTTTIHNKGCGYAMFNIFKALRLYGIGTLPGIGRAAGPGPIPADDWYADYVDNLLSLQNLPTDATRGDWSANGPNRMAWSCCDSNTTGITALAELILAPVAFVQPDPVLFSTIGLSPASATNPVGSSHTVTALAQSANNNPVPGVIIDFRVLSGPNVGKTGQGTTNSTGQTSFTYQDTGGPGTDTIQAFIGQLGSNVVTKEWVLDQIACDIDGDKDVDTTDLTLIRNANGQAPGANNPRDANKDGRINVSDVRYCQLRLAPAPQ